MMTINVSSNDFRRAVLAASSVVERRNTLPILSAVKCVANGAFEATGTDLDISVKATVPREAGGHSEFALTPWRETVKAITAAGGDVISIVDRGGKVDVRSGDLTINATTLPADDFPLIDGDRGYDTEYSATLSGEHLSTLSRVSGAASTDEARYYLNGVNMVQLIDEPAGLRFQATDGHRLYVSDIVTPDATGVVPKSTIIPGKVVRLLMQLAAKADDGIRMSIVRVAPENTVGSTAPDRVGLPRISFAFSVNGMAVVIVAKLIDGTYPDVSRVIPQGGEKQMVFDSGELTRALCAVSGFSKDIRAVKIELNKGGMATVSAAFIGLGLSASVTVPCQHKSPGFSVGYNGNYLRSVIAAARGSEIVFDTADKDSPALIRNTRDASFTGVLMPMRL